MLETGSEKDRDMLYEKCNSRWKSEDEVTSREMRKVLRRKMTRLSLDHLNQVCLMCHVCMRHVSFHLLVCVCVVFRVWQ